MGTIEEAKEYMRERLNEGVACPCCNQFVKMYKRKLNSSMAYALMIMYRFHKKKGSLRFVKMNEEVAKLGIPSSNIEYPKLKYWDLVEEMENHDETKKCSGFWRLTKKGYDFIQEKITVPSHVYVYNKKRYGYSEKKVGIAKVFSKKFDYNELMNKA